MLRLPGLIWSAALGAVVLATPAVALAAPPPASPVYTTAIQSWPTTTSSRVDVREGAEFDAAAFAAVVRAGHGVHGLSADRSLEATSPGS